MTIFLVGVGGVVGVLARYALGTAVPGNALPWLTVGINIVGSFLLGLLVAEQRFSRDMHEGLGVGFLGGFTTFSTFSVQAVLEVEGGRPETAVIYVLASVLGGLAAAAAGYALGRSLA